MRKVCGAGALMVLCSAVTIAAADNAVIEAIKSGNSQAVRGLLQKRADVNAAEADGMTALHWASRNNDLASARLLVGAGANPKATTRYGVTPLALAAQNGSAPMLDLLLKAGADANTALPEGETTLMTAARTGSAASIKVLASHGANVNAHETWMGESALSWAAAENHSDAVKALIELGADVNAKSTVLSFPEFKWTTSGMVSTALPRGGWTPLMHAARQGALEAGKAIAESPQIDLNIVDPDGTTALVVAIINAHYDFAAMLLDKGADPNVADSTGTAALYFLVDMHTLGGMQGRPAPKLNDAIDAEALLKKLIAKGANPNARLQRPMLGRYHGSGDATLGEGTTPFLRAAKAVDVPFMRVLLDGGADPTMTKKDRTNAAMLVAAGQANSGYLGAGPDAAVSATIEALTLCEERGVDLNAFNTSGQTAMHVAAGRGLDPVVKFLAEHGARLDRTDKQGRTPLDVALGVGAGAARGGNNRNAAGPRESTAALLRQLMTASGRTTATLQ
jgi:ankyrin repeat protein